MSCSPYDLRDYLFEELSAAQAGDVRQHLKACSPCSSELQALRLTHSTLLALRDEAMPQRIGFVSDKVFEPHPVRRWLAGFWTSAARLGFASAALLSAAILAHPIQIVQNVHKDAQSAQSVAQVSQAEIDRRIDAAVAAAVEAKVAAQVNTAVAQAVAETEKSAQQRTMALLAVAEKRHDTEQQAIRAEFRGQLDYLTSKYKVAMVSAAYSGGGQ